MPDPAVREQATAELLDAWPWDLGGAIIGGYAVAAYGAPRYSDDLDIVVPVAALEPLVGWLEDDNKFDKEQVPADLMQNYAGKVGRWARGELTVDLLPGVVRDREAQVDIPESWITRDPRRVRLVLLDASTRAEVPVVRPEAFWALKLQAGRPRDLGDLLSIQDEPMDTEEVQELFASLWCDTLTSKLHRVVASLDNDNVYHDTLSQRARGSPNRQENQRDWTAFKRNVRACIPSGLLDEESEGT